MIGGLRRGGTPGRAWGLAKVIARPGTGAPEGDATGSPEPEEEPSGGSIVGTPVYMAPEQARGLEDRIDSWTDILCDAGREPVPPRNLTGRPPYQSRSGDGGASVQECSKPSKWPAPRHAPARSIVPCPSSSTRSVHGRWPASRPIATPRRSTSSGTWMVGSSADQIAAFPEFAPSSCVEAVAPRRSVARIGPSGTLDGNPSETPHHHQQPDRDVHPAEARDHHPHGYCPFPMPMPLFP